MSTEFQFGRAEVNAHSRNCCGKVVGCDQTHKECLYLRHPWKRAMVFGDKTVRCQMKCQRQDSETEEWWYHQCSLLHGHEGVCELAPLSKVIAA